MKKRSVKAKSTNAGKNVTLDDLARMMANGFSETRADFKEVHGRIDELDERLSGQLTGIDERLSGQMRMLDQKVGIVNTNVLSMQYDYKKVILRIENLELKTFGSLQE